MAKKRSRKVTEGLAHIKASFNNTMISISDPQGNVLCTKSAGSSGFKGSRKGTPYGAQLASEEVARIARENYEMRRVSVRVKGPGAGRDSAIRALKTSGLEILSLEDCTALPHNGCRARKKRRV